VEYGVSKRLMGNVVKQLCAYCQESEGLFILQIFIYIIMLYEIKSFAKVDYVLKPKFTIIIPVVKSPLSNFKNQII
jgi:hypothetical protein